MSKDSIFNTTDYKHVSVKFYLYALLLLLCNCLLFNSGCIGGLVTGDMLNCFWEDTEPEKSDGVVEKILNKLGFYDSLRDLPQEIDIGTDGKIDGVKIVNEEIVKQGLITVYINDDSFTNYDAIIRKLSLDKDKHIIARVTVTVNEVGNAENDKNAEKDKSSSRANNEESSDISSISSDISSISDYSEDNDNNIVYIVCCKDADCIPGLFAYSDAIEIEILSCGNNIQYMYGMFECCTKLEVLNLEKLITINVTNMNWMFYNCSSLTSLNLSNFDTKNVTNMGEMFLNCTGLTSLDLSNFNTENVKGMGGMFHNCSSLTSLNLSSFDTENVINICGMFFGCSSLTSLNLSNFNTDNVTNMQNMFYNCISLTSLDLKNFNTNKVTDMSYMFFNCTSLKSLNLSSFKTDKVKDMCFMFYNCNSLGSLNLSKFNTSKIEYMNSMFANCSSLKKLDISSFDTKTFQYMSGMFDNCFQCNYSDDQDNNNGDNQGNNAQEYASLICSGKTLDIVIREEKCTSLKIGAYVDVKPDNKNYICTVNRAKDNNNPIVIKAEVRRRNSSKNLSNLATFQNPISLNNIKNNNIKRSNSCDKFKYKRI